MKNKLDEINENEFPLNFDEEYNKDDIKFEINQIRNEIPLYYIEFNKETGMFHANFNRNEKDHTPQVDDNFNIKFFYYLQKPSNYHNSGK